MNPKIELDNECFAVECARLEADNKRLREAIAKFLESAEGRDELLNLPWLEYQFASLTAALAQFPEEPK